MIRIEFSPAVSYGKKKIQNKFYRHAQNFSRRFLRKKKIKPRSYRTYSQRFRKEKRRFGNYHEVLLYFLLFVVKNSHFFWKRQKTVFTTPLTRNTLSTNVSTNIPNVELPLAESRAVWMVGVIHRIHPLTKASIFAPLSTKSLDIDPFPLSLRSILKKARSYLTSYSRQLFVRRFLQHLCRSPCIP